MLNWKHNDDDPAFEWERDRWNPNAYAGQMRMVSLEERNKEVGKGAQNAVAMILGMGQ
jgi:hypothetical protein